MSVKLDQRVASAFYGGFAQLREAQEATIEPILSGRNVILTSGTGSGKTEAVMAPLISRYWSHAITTDRLVIVYIAPTKALVNDLEKRLQPPLEKLGLRVGIRHGDHDDLTRKTVPHVLITTPESLDVLLFRKDPAIQSVCALVIDEVHLLYNTQRGLQLSILIQRLQQLLPSRLQWAAISATVSNPDHVREFLVGTNGDADLIQFSTTRSIDTQIRRIRNLQQLVSIVRRLTSGQPTKLLIFANSRRECERVAGALQEDDTLRQFIFTHYSSLSSEVRAQVEFDFSSMRTAVCVATSTLELGIDIGDIDAVLLWGVPGSVASFLQRIGRSNRRSNKTNVVCLVPDTSSVAVVEALRFVALYEAASRGELAIVEPYDLFGAVGQQCLSAIVSDGGRFTKIADLCRIVEHKRYISRAVVEDILAELASNRFIQRHGYKNRYGADEELYRLVDLRLIYGNFGVGSQMVDVLHGTKRLGEVPAMNLLRIGMRTHVRFAGACWRVKKASRDGIILEPSGSTVEAIDFSYGGSSIQSDAYSTDRTWKVLHAEEFRTDVFTKELAHEVEFFRDQIKQGCSEDQIPYVRSFDGIRYFTFGGYLVNRAIGLYSKKPDFQADDVSLSVTSPIVWSSIPHDPCDFEAYFHLLFESSSQQTIYQKQLPLYLQETEFLQDWLKDTTIPQILLRLKNARAVEVPNLPWR